MNPNSSVVDGFIDPLLLEKQESLSPRQQHTNIDSDYSSSANQTISGQIPENVAALSAVPLRSPNVSTELTAYNPRALDRAIEDGLVRQMAEPICAAVDLNSLGNKFLRSPASNHSRGTPAQSISSSMGDGLKTAGPNTAAPRMTIKKRGRPRKILTNATLSTKEPTVAADVRAQRIRDKNRAAADKCRSRRRLEEDRLRARHECIQKQHRNLSVSLSGLSEEVHVLRNMLLAHGTCDCWLIQDYLKRAASKWVTRQLKRSTALSVAV